MINCPLGLSSPDCRTCPFAKEGLCDYPYIGRERCEVEHEPEYIQMPSL